MNVLTIPAVQGAACGLMIGAVLLVGGRVWRPATVAAQVKQPTVADVVRARRFEMVDAAGNVRAVLRMFPSGNSGLYLYDVIGKLQVSLRVLSDEGPHLVMSDAAGKVIWKAP